MAPYDSPTVRPFVAEMMGLVDRLGEILVAGDKRSLFELMDVYLAGERAKLADDPEKLAAFDEFIANAAAADDATGN